MKFCLSVKLLLFPLFLFSEEATLVDQFVCEILVTFVNSLALAHHDEKAIGRKLVVLNLQIQGSCSCQINPSEMIK